jgi:hypothetical protein
MLLIDVFPAPDFPIRRTFFFDILAMCNGSVLATYFEKSSQEKTIKLSYEGERLNLSILELKQLTLVLIANN